MFTGIFMIHILVQLKAPLKELFNDFNEMIHWNIKDKKNIIKLKCY